MSKKQTSKNKSTKKVNHDPKKPNKSKSRHITTQAPEELPDTKEENPPSEPVLSSGHIPEVPSSGHILFWRKSTIETKNQRNLNLSFIATDDIPEVFDSFFKQSNPEILIGDPTLCCKDNSFSSLPFMSSEYSEDKDVSPQSDYIGETIVLLQDNNATIIASPWFFEPNNGNPYHVIIPSLIACKHLPKDSSPYLTASLTNAISKALNPLFDYLSRR